MKKTLYSLFCILLLCKMDVFAGGAYNGVIPLLNEKNQYLDTGISTLKPIPLIGDISGNIHTESNSNMENVTVNLSGPVNLTTTTDANGNYSFIGVPNGVYDVCPEHDVDPLSGISTFDLVLISKAILNIQPLASPYKIMAADVMGDGATNPAPDVADMLVLRKLILFIINDFPNVPSWVFVPDGHVFNNPLDPWDPAPPPSCKSVTISGGNAIGVDFIGIKKGDVN